MLAMKQKREARPWLCLVCETQVRNSLTGSVVLPDGAVASPAPPYGCAEFRRRSLALTLTDAVVTRTAQAQETPTVCSTPNLISPPTIP